MTGLSKLLMAAGAVLFITGFLMNFIKIGKLPGDILIKKGNATFYFPVITSILISVILSLIIYAINRFR